MAHSKLVASIEAVEAPMWTRSRIRTQEMFASLANVALLH